MYQYRCRSLNAPPPFNRTSVHAACINMLSPENGSISTNTNEAGNPVFKRARNLFQNQLTVRQRARFWQSLPILSLRCYAGHWFNEYRGANTDCLSDEKAL
jgi:hypothetical protein